MPFQFGGGFLVWTSVKSKSTSEGVHSLLFSRLFGLREIRLLFRKELGIKLFFKKGLNSILRHFCRLLYLKFLETFPSFRFSCTREDVYSF